MEKWIIRQTVDLIQGYGRRVMNTNTLATLNNHKAHQWRVTVVKNGGVVSLAGCNVVGYFVRKDQITVMITGAIEGNVAMLDLEQAVYAVKGEVRCIMNITQGDEVMTACEMRIVVDQGATDAIIDPGEVIPSLDELLAMIEEMKTVTGEAEVAIETIETLNEDVTAAEADRVSAETSRDTAEQNRASAEGLRVTAEQARVSAEGLRVTAEQNRATAESERVTAEQGRVSAEGQRVTVESGRVSAETGRATAEQGRVAAEQARATASATAVTNANNAASGANQATSDAIDATENAEAVATKLDGITFTRVDNHLIQTTPGEPDIDHGNIVGAVNGATVGSQQYEPDDDGKLDLLPIVKDLAVPYPRTKGNPITLNGLIDGIPFDAVLSIYANITEPEGDKSPDNPGRMERTAEVGAYHRGRNFNSQPMEAGSINNTTGLPNTGVGVRSAGLIPLLGGITYAMQNDKGYANVVHFYDADGAYIGYINLGADITFTPPVNTRFVRIRSSVSSGQEIDTSVRYQIEVGTSLHDIQPYTGQDITIPIGQEIGGLEDAPDYVDFARKVLKIASPTITLTPDMAWIVFASGAHPSGYSVFYFDLPGALPGLQTSWCDSLPNINSGWSVAAESISDRGSNTYKYVTISNARIGVTDDTSNADKLVAYRTWLAANPMVFSYLRATPIEIPLSDAALAELAKLVSYDGENNLSIDWGEIEAGGYYSGEGLLAYINDTMTALQAAVTGG